MGLRSGVILLLYDASQKTNTRPHYPHRFNSSHTYASEAYYFLLTGFGGRPAGAIPTCGRKWDRKWRYQTIDSGTEAAAASSTELRCCQHPRIKNAIGLGGTKVSNIRKSEKSQATNSKTHGQKGLLNNANMILGQTRKTQDHEVSNSWKYLYLENAK